MVISLKRIKKVLNEEAYKEFEEFMKGQTVAIDGVYDHDFVRFMQQRGVID